MSQAARAASIDTDPMAKIRAAVALAPEGAPVTEVERVRIEQNAAAGHPGMSGEELLAGLGLRLPG